MRGPRRWRGRSGRLTALAAACAPIGLVIASCLRFAAFACDDDGNCDATTGGVCTAAGHCAYPDATCLDGLRYDEHAESDLAGVCVDLGGTGSTTVVEPTSSATTLDTTVNPTTTTEPPTTTTTAPTSDTGTDTGDACGGADEPCCAMAPACADGLACLGDACGCIAQLEAGERHTCAVTFGGGVLCWGANDSGQLGQSLEPFETSPVAAIAVVPNDPIREISAVDHTCVRSEQGNIRCFGANDSGQVDPVMPQPISPSTAAAWAPSADHVAVGVSHTCAADGVSLLCWGTNGSSQLTGVDPGPGPVTFGVGPVSALEVGGAFGCVIQSNTLSCWGSNNRGQLATDPAVTGSLPTPTTMPVADVTAVALGRTHACALTAAGAVSCWGRGTEGQLGNGVAGDQFTPAAVTFPIEAGIPVAIEAGDQHTCVIDDADALWCWGSNADGQLMLEPDGMGFDGYTLVPVPIEVGAGILAVAGGVTHTCVLTDAAQVLCWGTNSEGQIGDGTTNYAFEPQVAAVSCG